MHWLISTRPGVDIYVGSAPACSSYVWQRQLLHSRIASEPINSALGGPQWKKYARASTSRGSEYPVKRQDSPEFRPGRFPMPTAVGIRARQLLAAKKFHRFGFRQRHVTAFLL